MDPFLDEASARAPWNAAKMGKTTLFEGAGLMVGLNAFEPGQEHAPHAHAGADKLYQVLAGRGRFAVAGAEREVGPGGLVFAPAGVAHGVRNAGPDLLLVLVAMGPPPGR